MQKQTKLAIGVITGGLLLAGGVFVYQNFRGIGPAVGNPPQNIVDIFSNRNSATNTNQVTGPAVNTTDFPLQLPDGFQIDLVASELPNARVLRFDAEGDLWLSQPQRGTVAELDIAADGTVASRKAVFTGLDNPHGVVFDPDDADIIFIAEEGRVIRSRVSKPSERTSLMTMPTDGGHSSRTLGIGPNKRLYVSIGSSCNVCREDNEKRASIWVLDRDGSNQARVASGLRNTVFFTWKGNELWGTDMGRDLLGDDIPPDEVNQIVGGKDYGWPYCYGQKVHDKKFDGSSEAADRCARSEPAKIDLQAHSAPLGLAFIQDETWPQDWQNDLVVAYHGSWNRSVPTGYKLVRHKFSEAGAYEGVEDFVTGWLSGGGALGRPVDVVLHDHRLFVSDDKAGVIYKISPP